MTQDTCSKCHKLLPTYSYENQKRFALCFDCEFDHDPPEVKEMELDNFMGFLKEVRNAK